MGVKQCQMKRLHLVLINSCQKRRRLVYPCMHSKDIYLKPPRFANCSKKPSFHYLGTLSLADDHLWPQASACMMHLHFSSVTSQFQFGFSTAGLNKKCTSIHVSPADRPVEYLYIPSHTLSGDKVSQKKG